MTVRKLGLVANVHKADIKEMLQLVASILPEEVDLVAMEETARIMPGKRAKVVDSFSSCDAVVAFGGDGTLLTAARHTTARDQGQEPGIPNRGRSGAGDRDPLER